MKKAFNIFSYVLNILFIAALVYYYFGQGIGKSEERIQSIRSGIVERERANIPLLVQRLGHVHSITIDSLVLTNNIEPYSGYLVTRWDAEEWQQQSYNQWVSNGGKDKYIRKKKTILVPVSKITTSRTSMTWETDWEGAYRDAVENKMK